MIKTEQTYENAAIGYNDEVLQDIHLPAKNIAIYKRKIDPQFMQLKEVTSRTIECRASGTVEEVAAVLRGYFKSHLPFCPVLLDDVVALLGQFEEVTGASAFNLLLATVETNMCRKFHTDINNLRLLCTYFGPGTLWLPNEIMDSKVSVARSGDHEINIDAGHIQQVQTGDVAILKGALYPGANPVFHRSPAVEETAEKRLLLRIDTNASQNLWS